MACDQVCVLCDSLCSCVDGLRPSRDRAAVGSTVAGHRGGHACPRRLHLMACVETKHPATRSALGRAARGSRAARRTAGRARGISLPQFAIDKYRQRQRSKSNVYRFVRRAPLRAATDRHVCPGACVPARVSRHDAARRPSPQDDVLAERATRAASGDKLKKNIEPNLSSDKARVSVAPQERAKERN